MLHTLGKNLRLKFIIAGTGRCGTVYVAKLLTLLGIPCSHERIFTNKGLEKSKNDSNVSVWAGLRTPSKIVAEASYMAVPYLDHPSLKYATIIHLVRDPIKVIQSFGNKLQYFRHQPNAWEQFIYKHMPELEELETPLLRCCAYVLWWNKKVEEKDCIRILLEKDIDKLLHYLKIEASDYPKKIENSFEVWNSTKLNLPPEEMLTEEKIYSCKFGEEIKNMRKQYGYSGSPND